MRVLSELGLGCWPSQHRAVAALSRSVGWDAKQSFVLGPGRRSRHLGRWASTACLCFFWRHHGVDDVGSARVQSSKGMSGGKWDR